MNYIISKFACILSGEGNSPLSPYVKYCVNDTQHTTYMVYGANGELPFPFLFKESKNVLKIEYGGDYYYYLSPSIAKSFMTEIKFLSRMVCVTIGERLSVTIDGESVCNEYAINVDYSHFEIRRNYLIIYFKGVRDYVVIIKEKTLCVASYYDEINIVDGELIFMCKCNDSLHHGKVYYLNKNYEYSTYLVYLDKTEIKVTSEFIPFIFLDTLLAGNLKYANRLLDDSLKQADENKIIEFFNSFTEYIPIGDAFALINKNTLAGICKFQLDNDKITNIIL